MASDSFADYFSTVRDDFQAGNATEHTHRPTLKTLLEALDPRIKATNEPKHVECGAPDYLVTRAACHEAFTVGYVEAKDIGKRTLDIEHTDQMRRYLAALPNLILTNSIEFRWYVDGTLRDTA